MRRDIIIGVSAGVGGILVGGTATYFIFRRRVIRNAEERANKEIASVKDTYKLLRKEPPYDKPETAIPAYLDRVSELQYLSEIGVEAAQEAAEDAVIEAEEDLEEAIREEQAVEDIVNADPEARSEEVLTNIFEEARKKWKNPEGESTAPAVREVDAFDVLQARDASAPYVISTDEFMDDENEFDKITITFFEGDNTLADDAESIIPDVEGTVGKANLNKFGVDSDSRDIVYIRNERLLTDFEVIREEGEYAEIVAGVKPYVHDRRVKRMRDDE